ncbi:UNVERIFIED_CONTAM: acyltransferase [Methylobacteriaceae bacterium AG10]|nr:acyltransferase [Methylobacteriaceae bacterium AG10]
MLARLARMLPRPARTAPLVAAHPATGLGPGVTLEAGPVPVSAGRRVAAGLANIQILRGLAAATVLVHHAAVYAQILRGAEPSFPTFEAMMGVWGVAVFFAISGTLMAGLVVRDRPLVFLAHRISRIFPTYLAVVALFAAVFAALGLSLGGLAPLSLSLAPAGPRSYALNVEWTLVFETSFYVGLFGLASAGLAHRIVPLAVLWLILLAAAFLLLPAASRDLVLPPAYMLPVAAACVPFAGGLLLPRLIASGRITPMAGLLALPLFAACLFVERDLARWLGGIAAVLLVGAAASARQARGEGAVTRAALSLGDASYVLYLVHVPVLVLTARAVPAHWSGLAYGLTAIVVALGLAVLLGPVDLALYRALRRRIDAAAPVTLRRWLAAYLLMFAGCAAWGSADTARDDWQERRARMALAALPAGSWADPAAAAAAIDGRGLTLPASMQGALEFITRTSPVDAVVSAYAYDPARPTQTYRLAVYCSGRLIGLDRPRRMRKDLAEVIGPARPGHRIGFWMQIPAAACAADPVPLALAIDADGRMGVLAAPGR